MGQSSAPRLRGGRRPRAPARGTRPRRLGRPRLRRRLHAAEGAGGRASRAGPSVQDLPAGRPRPPAGQRPAGAAPGLGARSEPFHVVTVLWLVDDFTPTNGATRLVPGSHLVPRPMPKALLNPEHRHPDQKLVLAEAGSVLLFNGTLLHGGTRLGRSGPRRALQCQFRARELALPPIRASTSRTGSPLPLGICWVRAEGTIPDQRRTAVSRIIPATLLAALALASAAAADDWPQWMGPNRDGVWRETGILDKFPEGGPKVLWRAPVAGGLRRARPSPAAGSTSPTTSQGDGDDVTTADPLDADRAQGQGARPLPRRARPARSSGSTSTTARTRSRYPAGPRCTPTVARRQGLHPRRDGRPLLPRRREGHGPLVEGLHEGLRREGADVGLLRPPARRRREAHLPRRRRRHARRSRSTRTPARKSGRRCRRKETGYCPPTLIEAGRQAAAARLARRGGQRPRPGDGQAVLVGPADAEVRRWSIMAPRKDGDYLFARHGVRHGGRR